MPLCIGPGPGRKTSSTVSSAELNQGLEVGKIAEMSIGLKRQTGDAEITQRWEL